MNTTTEHTIVYHVRNVIEETPLVKTLELSCDTPLLPYRAGQFITVFFPETGHMEGKSYSISSAYGEKTLRISVKKMGVFSNKLVAMRPGDSVVGSLPYGYFYSDSTTSSLVMIAAGIAIAPLRSMIVESLHNNSARSILLFYVNKTHEGIIFKEELDLLSQRSNGNFVVKYYVTQEEAQGEVRGGRIPVNEIIQESEQFADREFFICGSIAFVREYWKALRDSGIKEEALYTEAFF